MKKRKEAALASTKEAHKGPDYVQVIVLIILSVLPYLSNLDGEFVFDDAESVKGNPVVTGEVSLKEILFRDFWGRPLASRSSHKSFRPVTTFTFWLNYISSNSTISFHATNIVLHATVVLLLYKFMIKLENQLHLHSKFAFPASVAFAVHPIHTEAVANITGRAELLSAVFFILTISNNIDSTFDLFRIFVFSILSLFSKEQGIASLPALLALKLITSKIERKRASALVVLTAAQVSFRLYLNGGSPTFKEVDNAAVFVKDPFLRWCSISWQWLYHLYLLVIPSNLCFDYSMGCVPAIKSYLDPRIISLPLCALIAVLAYGMFQKMKDPSHQRVFATAVSFSILTFFPASNILFTVGFTVAERVLYLPSIGYCILLAMIYNYAKKINRNFEIIAMIMIGVAAAQCYQRSSEWKDELSLYSSGLRVCPHNAKIHYNLAKVMSDRGLKDVAEQEYWEAVRLNPSYESALNNLGNILERTGRLSESATILRAAIRARPGFAGAWMNLGITLMKMGEYEESSRCFEQSLSLRPNSADCYFNFGNLKKSQNQLSLAAQYWRNATTIDSSHSAAWINLLLALEELQRCNEVLQISSEAMRHHSSVPAIRTQIGVCFAQMEMFEEAEEHLLETLNLRPQSPEHYANLGVLYQRWGRHHDARAAYLKALELEPGAAHIRSYLEQMDTNRRRSNTTITY